MKKSETVLHVIRLYDRLPPMPGGMERHISELTKAQRKMGVRVTNVYNTGMAEGDSIRVLSGFNLHKLRPNILRDFVFFLAAAFVKYGFSGNEVRILHVHGGWSAFLFARVLAKFLGIKFVAASLHAFIQPAPILHRFSLRGCWPVFATGYNEVIYLSGVIKKRVIHLPSAPADIFFNEPSKSKDAVDVIVVSNLFPIKNVELVLRVASCRRHMQFAIYGDGSERERLERLKDSLRLDNVIFHGEMPVEDVRDALCFSRVFLSVSLSEGSPTAALEAMACGLPVILTPSNDYSEIIIPGGNGIVTNGWCVEDVVSALDMCLVNEGVRHEMGKAARSMARKHRWSIKAELVTSTMIDAIDGN